MVNRNLTDVKQSREAVLDCPLFNQFPVEKVDQLLTRSRLIDLAEGEFLLQRRAADKYHSAGLWTNTCCSHPRPNESTMAAAIRRLYEEMGMATSLKHLYHFTYKAEFDNGLTEHELDHVYLGTFNDAPNPDPNEVMEWKYMKWVLALIILIF